MHEYFDWRYSSIIGTSIHDDNNKKSVHLIFGLFCMGKLLSALITSPLEPEHVKAEIKSERGRAYSTNILRECIKYTVLFSFFELITE